MNNIFSLKRIGLILRADWIEHRKNWMITMGLLLLAYVFLLWGRTTVQGSMIGWTFFISVFLSFGFVGKKIHRPKGLFLTLPASNPEKFVAMWLVILFHLVSFFLVLLGVAIVNNLISGYSTIELWKITPKAGVVAVTVFFTCWQFASHVTFRKNAFIIGLALLIALIAGLVRIVAEFVSIERKSWDLDGSGFGRFMEFAGEHYCIVIYLLSAALLYYSYRRLTKKQIR